MYNYMIDLVNKIKVGAVIQNVGKMSKLRTDKILLPQRVLVGCSREFKINQIKNSVYTSIEKNSLIHYLQQVVVVLILLPKL